MAKVFIALIRLYQLTLSKLLVAIFGPVCRFEPSCSAYAAACLRDHGMLRGSLLSVKRLCRCHPFHPGGFDPPPPAPGKTDRASRTDSSNTQHHPGELVASSAALPSDRHQGMHGREE